MSAHPEFDEQFCRLAVERGLCEAPAIRAALSEQTARQQRGENISIAAVLAEQGALTAKQAERLSAEILKEAAAFPEIPGFAITGELARAGLTRVYQGHQKSVDRPVLLKVLAKTSINDGPATEQFQREARLLAALNHRHISGAIDMGETPACLYLVLHHFRGQRLSELLAQEGCLDEGRLLACALSLAEALDYIHGRRLAHGNVCPENVIVTEEGNLLLTGFDLIGDDGPYTPPAGEIVPAYRHALCAELTASRVDLFALGCLLFQAATGKSPFAFPRAPYPQRPVVSRYAFLSSATAAVIHTLLDLRSRKGYQNAPDLLADLHLLEEAHAPRHVQKLPGIWGLRLPELPLWPTTKRGSRGLAVAGALAGLAGGAALFLLLQAGKETPGRVPMQLLSKDHWQGQAERNASTEAARMKWVKAERLVTGGADDRKQAAALYQSILKDHAGSVYAKPAERRLRGIPK